MAGYMRNFSDITRMLQKGLDDTQDVASYMQTPPQLPTGPTRPPFRAELGEVGWRGGASATVGQGRRLYDGFSLHIRPGERVALVGPTGSGKSTFVKLLQRLYDVQGGRILIDGQDIAQVRQEDLRRAIAVVPQDPALFHRSIAENIGYARPDATLDEIALAARRARAARLHRRPAEGLRDAGRRAGREALGRRAAAGGDRPGLPGRRADPGAGRGDLVARRRDRGAGAGGDRGADGGAHHDRHRPPALDHPRAPTGSWCSRAAASSRKAATANSWPRAAPTPGCTR